MVDSPPNTVQEGRIQDILDRLGQGDSPFVKWVRGKSEGRGVPTWTDRPNTGKYGGGSWWQPGMPRAPGNSPSAAQGRMGGTYTPSGNMPIPIPNAPATPSPAQPIPSATGSMPPTLVGGGGGGAGAASGPPRVPLLPAGFLNATGALASPMAGIASQRDVGWPARTQGATNIIQPPPKTTFSQGGAAAMPIPTPPSQGGAAQGGIPPIPPPWNNPQKLPNANLQTQFNNPPGVMPRPKPPMPMATPGQGKGAVFNPITAPGQGKGAVFKPLAIPGQGKGAGQSIPPPPQQQAGLDALLRAIFGGAPQQAAIQRQAPTP